MSDDFGFGFDEAPAAAAAPAAPAADEEEFGMGFGEEEEAGFGDQAAAAVEAVKVSEPEADGVIESIGGDEAHADGGSGKVVLAERSGWLQVYEPKRTLSRKAGRKESWFNLTPDGLSMGSSAVNIKTTYKFNEIRSVVHDEDVPISFELTTAKKKLFLTAKTEEQAKEWVDSLQLAFKKVQGGFATRRASATAAMLF